MHYRSPNGAHELRAGFWLRTPSRGCRVSDGTQYRLPPFHHLSGSSGVLQLISAWCCVPSGVYTCLKPPLWWTEKVPRPCFNKVEETLADEIWGYNISVETLSSLNRNDPLRIFKFLYGLSYAWQDSSQRDPLGSSLISAPLLSLLNPYFGEIKKIKAVRTASSSNRRNLT